jgi:hypothetical protein
MSDPSVESLGHASRALLGAERDRQEGMQQIQVSDVPSFEPRTCRDVLTSQEVIERRESIHFTLRH